MAKIEEFVTEYIDEQMYLMIPLGTKKRDVGNIAAEKMCFGLLKIIDGIEQGKGSYFWDLKLQKDLEVIKKRINRILR